MSWTGALQGLFGRRERENSSTLAFEAPPTVGSDSTPTRLDHGRSGSESAQRRFSGVRRQHRSAAEHAEQLLRYIQANVDPPEFGLLLHTDMLEFYTAMLSELGWWERSWAPVAREFDLLTTGGAKPYTWIFTKSGRKARRRCYPIPQASAAADRDICRLKRNGAKLAAVG